MMSFKLSCKNMKKSFNDYSIYFITLIFGIAIFYIFNSIDAQSSMLALNSSKSEMVKNLVEIIGAISIFVSVILGFLIVYANNFLIRRRKKELGLYMTLGMSKGKISQLLLMETVLIGILSLVIGLVVGIFSSQLISVGIAKMFEADMTKFEFVFSQGALFKTCIYFGIIYILVMIFNIITISKYKLINLIYANKKNEKFRIKNKFVTIILFIFSIAFIGYSYYLLKNGALMDMNINFIYMIIAGSLGTLLFFASLSGFLLRIIQMNKKIYLRDLNMFVLRQINSRINTNMISMTLICIMLLLTIGILSGAMSLNDTFNSDLKENNLTDISMVNYVYPNQNGEYNNDEIINIEERFAKDGFDISKYIKEYAQYNIYDFKDSTTLMKNFLSKEDISNLEKEFGSMLELDDIYLYFVKQSEYNKLMEISNKSNLKVDLKDNEYIMAANIEKLVNVYNNSLKNNTVITINNKKYFPQKEACIEVAIQNSNTSSNLGIVVIDDGAVVNMNLNQNIICGNYLAKDDTESEKIEENFINDENTFYMTYESKGLYKPYEMIRTKIEMEASSLGIKAILTFIGLYLGIIFSITSAAILAIQQLSQSADNKERYGVLRKIGVDTKMINRSLFIQIAIFFMLPLSLAIVHSIVGLSELNRLISVFAHLDLTKNIIYTSLFILLVYGGYFIATYIGSKYIIKEQDR